MESGTLHGLLEGVKGDQVVLKLSMKNLLVDACKLLGIDTPEFYPYPTKFMHGSLHHSFMCYLRSSKIQDTPIEVCPYQTSADLAMEQVSLQWLRRLEKTHHLAIVDYNHHMVQGKNDQIQGLEVENFDLVMENSSLKQQVMNFRSMLQHP